MNRLTRPFATIGDAIGDLDSVVLGSTPNSAPGSTPNSTSGSTPNSTSGNSSVVLPADTAQPLTSGGGPTPPPRLPNSGGDSGGSPGWFRRQWNKLVAWLMAWNTGRTLLLLFWLIVLPYIGVFLDNFRQPFAISDRLDHGGSWPRQVFTSVVDRFKSRSFFIKTDWLGQKYVVYRVGSRTFVQLNSGEPAVEVLLTNVKTNK